MLFGFQDQIQSIFRDRCGVLLCPQSLAILIQQSGSSMGLDDIALLKCPIAASTLPQALLPRVRRHVGSISLNVSADKAFKDSLAHLLRNVDQS
jgi:hypothetical protein